MLLKYHRYKFIRLLKIIFIHLFSKNLKQKMKKEGIVKFFNSTKGFGFIKETSTGEEYFVHVSGLVDDIQENDSVEFEAEQGKKGINAVQVRLIR
jgi:CspA family cold shock protein